MLIVLLLVGFLVCSIASATTYYVRSDGGTADQCTGLVDAAYSGSGSAQACAWANPMVALPPAAYGQTPVPRIAGGDTLSIAPGSYMIGYGAPGANNCNTGATYACTMAPVPSGTASQPTRIIGGDCSQPPQLWGTQRAASVINLAGSSYVEVGCLEITDHSSCIENHCQMAGTCNGEINRCERDTYPYGTWAENGLTASDSAEVTLHDLNIHGMANEGVRAGRLTDWTMQRVRIYANGFGGWDNDIRNGVPTADTSNHGNIVFTDSEIGYNGCGEYYPSGGVYGCWGQNEGGYGDGLGAGPTGGNWSFVNVYVHHNTQDGLDLLYADGTGNIAMDRVKSEGNAGNQLKLAGNAQITNSVVVGNCAYYFYAGDLGADMRESDSCRAGGDAIAMLPGNDSGPSGTNPNHVVTLTVQNNTITGEGNGIIMLSRGNPLSTANFSSNVILGNENWQLGQSGYPELTGGIYYYQTDGYSSPTMNYYGNLFWNTKTNQCPSGSLCEDPQLNNESLDHFQAIPLPTSPVLNWAASANSTTYDFRGYARPSSLNGEIGYDVGAIQYQGEADDILFQGNFN